MQTTYHIKASEIDLEFIESIKKTFKADEVVTITVKSEALDDQYQMFLRSEALQKKYPPREVPNDIDLSALAHEVNL